MAEDGVKHVKVWSGWLRLAHTLIGLATLLLLATGWLIAESPALRKGALNVHYIGLALLLPGLLIRFWLLAAGKENERLEGLMPQSHEFQAMWETLRCYLSFGNRSLPVWYAQNPLWKPVYLVT
ncbi:MAG TPA: cytochrome b/b6 domain-containing protein, partial [Chromatiales bacterium]|nr:cytochrome b/b6 domain-containing protein [Chromatiales bacterium]